ALVVREMQHRANLRAERLALAPPEAVWPTVAGLRPSPAGTPQRSPEDTTPPPPPTVAVPDASASAQTATPAQSITPVRPQVPATPPSLVEALATLAEMRDRGLITSAEYDARKAELLSRF
ncbi:MAG: SHOCT domain-containing protein, partial [Candidatus Limnocylindrales bacterium]